MSLAAAEAFVREREAPAREELKARLVAFIGSAPRATSSNGGGAVAHGWSFADFARAVGRDPKDSTVRRAVYEIANDGLLHRNGDERWRRSGSLFELDDEEE